MPYSPVFIRLAATTLVAAGAALLPGAPVVHAGGQGNAPKTPASGNRLTVRLTDVSINKVPYIVAKEEGIFAKHGLDVDLYITSGAAATVKASGVDVPAQYVRADEGDVDLSTSGGSPVIVARTTTVRDRDRVILATTDHVVRWHVFAKPDITRLEQIKGRRLGVSGYGSCTGFIARLIAQKMGWNPEQDLSILYGSLGVRWLQDGVVDAVLLDETPYAYATKLGLKPIADLREWNAPIACSGVSATRTWLGQPGNRDRAKRFLMSLVEAIALMKQQPDSVSRAIGKWYAITDPERQRMMRESAKEMPSKPYPAVEGIKKVMELFNYHEMRLHKPEDFYDDSLMREIDASGFIDGLYKR
jgi:ABC-type nitrate/sulfonate/bicarbonate transport system substrate-binding protein